jgi:hypothetical protein
MGIKMRRDAKGRFTKALVKVRPKLPTDVQLARKLDKIQNLEKAVRASRLWVGINSLLTLAFVVTIFSTVWNASYVFAAITTIGAVWSVTETRNAVLLHLAVKAKHARLLKGAESLTNKLLAEEGISSDI